MKKSVTQLWITALTGILCLGVVFTFSATKNLSSQREVQGAGAGAPTLTSSTDAMDAAALKTFLEKYDAPSYTYTVNSTNNTYPSSGTTVDPNNHLDSWKFSSSKANGAADISGLPSYTLVKIWVARWSTDVTKLAVNGGTAQSITTNNYDLYTFDGFDNQTSFVIAATKRFMINKIEFYGC